MRGNQILGLIILVVGVVLLIFGINSSGSVGERLSEGITGRYTDTTMWYIIGGIVAIIAGGALMLFGRRRIV